MELKPHQRIPVKFMRTHNSLLLYHSVGSGKTLTAVAIADEFIATYPENYAIIITPKSLQGNFVKEMDKYGIKDKSHYKFFTPTMFYNNNDTSICKNNLIIIDEVHNLRTIPRFDEEIITSGKISEFLIRACAVAMKVLLLTATPVVNSEADIITLYKMLKQESLSECSVSYYMNTPEHFPTANYRNIYIPMTAFYEKNYKLIENDIDPDQGYNSNLSFFYNGVRAASNVIDGISPKLDYVVDLVERLPSDAKIVIYSGLIGNGIKKLIERLDFYPHSVIDGSKSKKDRDNSVIDYNTNKIKILFISGAGSEGLDLKETHSIILFEPSWNETKIQQVIGRAVRYKSHVDPDAVVDVYKLYLIKNHELKNIKTILQYKLLLNENREYLSIDLYLRNYSLRKQDILQELIDKLINISIEKSKVCM